MIKTEKSRDNIGVSTMEHRLGCGAIVYSSEVELAGLLKKGVFERLFLEHPCQYNDTFDKSFWHAEQWDKENQYYI